MSESPAADAAADEAELWASLIDVEPDGWDDVLPTESATVGYFDPADDLDKRAARWSHTFSDHHLGSLCAFAAGLAVAEAEAWESDEPHIATQAYEARRFLVSDRLIHWAVPWLDAVAGAYPDLRDSAIDNRTVLLELGDRLRPAPALTDAEGTVLEGHDSIGPLDPPGRLGTVQTGLVLMRPALAHIAPEGEPIADRVAAHPTVAPLLAELHEQAASQWRGLAWLHKGSEQLWIDLASRAEAAAVRLGR